VKAGARGPRGTGAQGHRGTGAPEARRAARASACALAVALAACGGARGALAQVATPARVADAHWDARLSVRSAPHSALGAARSYPQDGGTDDAPTASPRTRAFVTEVVLGALGSAGGAVAGLQVGHALCRTTSPCGGEDPGLVEGFTGAIVGSIVGTAFGTHVGARVSGGRGAHFGARLGGALLGLLAAGGAIQLAGGDIDQAVVLITIPIVQSLVTVLLTPRD
jgi:hypothetical protein